MKNEKFGIKYFYTGLTAFLVIAACVVFFFLMYRLPGIFAFLKKLLGVIEPVIIGFIIAYLVNPIANAINGGLLKLSKKNIKLQNNIYKRVNRRRTKDYEDRHSDCTGSTDGAYSGRCGEHRDRRRGSGILWKI